MNAGKPDEANRLYEFSICKMRYITSEDDRMKSNLREIDWSRGNLYTWKKEDIVLLSHSPNLFARKFSIHHRSVIDYIREHI